MTMSLPAIPSSVNSVVNPTLGALGVYSNLKSGTPVGYTRALAGGVNTVNNLLGGPSSISQAAGGLGNLAGIYGGLQQGGWQGYGGAAANAAQLAGSALGNTALSTVGGEIAAPLALYNAFKNWQSGNTGNDALNGAGAGASIGTYFVPGIGTVVGGLIGGAVGALSSAFGPGKQSAGDMAWKQYTGQGDTKYPGHSVPNTPFEESLLGAWQDNQKGLGSFTSMDDPTSGTGAGDKHGGNAEQFKGWLENTLAQAEATGQLKSGTSAQDAFNQVVGPAMDQYWKNTGSPMTLAQWKDPSVANPNLEPLLVQLTDRALSGNPIGRGSEKEYSQYGYAPVPTLSQDMQSYNAAHAPNTAPAGALSTVNGSSAVPGGMALNPSNSTVDYYHYGEGPEHQFFTGNQLSSFGGTPPAQAPVQAPQPVTAPRMQIPTAPTGAAVMAKGGALTQAFHAGDQPYVGSRTPSSGRADDIDAKLANNEYVMDAETVSMLGDGNPDEGARRLDELRAKIRTHKGKALAKGKFSPNAKRPEAYLGAK